MPRNSSVSLVVYNVGSSTAGEPYQLDFCTNTTSYMKLPRSIPYHHPNGVNAFLNVPTSGRISDINLRFKTGTGACDTTPGNMNAAVSHTFVGDLIFRLTAPDGFPTIAFMQRRGGTRKNICLTLIDDDGNFAALSAISNQTGFFVWGNYLTEPGNQLSRFDGESPQGNWVLNVSDNAITDIGILNRFTLEITTYPRKAPFDYTGGGRTDIAIWRPSTGFWFVQRSEDGSFYSFPFGAIGDVPTPGDYAGGGKSDAAVFRPSSSNWFAQRSTARTLIQQFGIVGDFPTPSAFVP